MAVKDQKRVDDHYSKKARQQGYPARSVYKLSEFNEKTNFLFPKQKVLDLGCAPGSWALYVAKIIGPQGLVVGLDLNKPTNEFPPNVILYEADLLTCGLELIEEFLPFDLVLSDMAPKTTGIKNVDQAKSLELCEMAYLWAKKVLVPNGSFLFKIFQSQDAEIFIKSLNKHFKKVSRLKPKATRRQSTEVFVLAENIKAETLNN